MNRVILVDLAGQPGQFRLHEDAYGNLREYLDRARTRLGRGQQVAGVCNGLSAYADVDVGWVRTIFLAATVVTAGLFLVVYLAMMFILPVAATTDWLAMLAATQIRDLPHSGDR